MWKALSMRPAELPLTEDQLKRILRNFDTNGDGKVSRKELKVGFKSMGLRFTGLKARSAVYHADANGDGVISDEEMNELAKHVSKSGKNKAMNVDTFVVDSSVTEWKPDIENKNNQGIWATPVMNEPILEEAYHNSSKEILIFSVNKTGFFQWCAQMMSSVGWRRDNVRRHGHGGSKPWGRSFKVKWLQLHDLPFQKTLHLKNPLNNYKTVKISRDCQACVCRVL